MRSVQPRTLILPFRKPKYATTNPRTPYVEPLDRIELHQAERDEIQALRTRLLNLIVEAEQQRKVSRLRLVN